MELRRLTVPVALAALVVAGCGGDDDDTGAADAGAGADADDSNDGDDSNDDGDAAEPAPSGGGGNGTATITLDNGESYEFSVLCSLEPQMAAGSEILFTAVSYDNPSLDITQFGDDGTVTGISTVSVYDAETYDTLWEGGSVYEAFGGGFELSLDGSTIRGSGSFYPEADISAAPVDGDVEARC